MKKHFGVNNARIYAVMRKNKANFAKDGKDGRPNLLIDDHAKNIDAFRNRWFGYRSYICCEYHQRITQNRV